MFPQPQIESELNHNQLFIVLNNDTIYKECLKSINYFKREHAQTQFWSNFENTKCSGALINN